jgi:hypothetical protein
MPKNSSRNSPFGKAPSAFLKDLFFLVDAASDVNGARCRAVMRIYDPVRRGMRPVMVEKNIYSEWAKIQKWLHGRRHLPSGRATGKIRPKADPRQLTLAL